MYLICPVQLADPKHKEQRHKALYHYSRVLSLEEKKAKYIIITLSGKKYLFFLLELLALKYVLELHKTEQLLYKREAYLISLIIYQLRVIYNLRTSSETLVKCTCVKRMAY